MITRDGIVVVDAGGAARLLKENGVLASARKSMKFETRPRNRAITEPTICANCDSEMPSGCSGTFKDEKECALNGGPTLIERMNALCDAAKDNEIADLTRQLTEAREAGERYAFIRAGHSEWHGDCYAMMFAEEGDNPITGDDLDAAVDAAIARRNAVIAAAKKEQP